MRNGNAMQPIYIRWIAIHKCLPDGHTKSTHLNRIRIYHTIPSRHRLYKEEDIPQRNAARSQHQHIHTQMEKRTHISQYKDDLSHAKVFPHAPKKNIYTGAKLYF